ncbi:glutamine--fructose-6-phosphate transaminase (isomerizing) [Haloferax mediterranei ATCC 33500]|uniref:Glutamine--fructose-6-phosphate aminotransferase [isomerizing] n=1 Tax=Haloferax mediterranei (strain ATCC 33500 / DSM 1411 / JCM 8866 / NBRC 14739 / NCIMB 2177 / R-4) TaxID=523841 RepID=I3R6H2_HALMT|nr:glutamine--fructose-6-phosphate transaminase (isomerizing) [Haloferax mediterranei]AFK19832.1 glutamine--fructose-6-phosphate aminotransferase (isomerizing) [Haloferax mediterranei ATCC 33500]ELZ99797.1 glucosamine--fructose-6-phosphate aminotransferase [Haloferax mediterranei ATCC 33500]MDX5987419.1 glutamine--fructose-6-phosphate transaminase (isomerizing) [Haloferax mediterranei ATCC 33500]QCQ73923.1 glutamine--fructose-6-phosphate transaminase (isomerizing) [Haloferax mediterranei ATCC 3
MCGITGYIGVEESASILASGLKNLEYRGYDSAGVALVGDQINVHKQEGTIDGLTIPNETSATHGIGHTRWSTHGEPTDENAHPHTDCSGDIAVVHNGIISNYDELKRQLGGHIFESETDTEVIPHLLEEEMATGADLRAAVMRVLDRLEGSFAVAATHVDYEGIVAARQDSPLVIGHGEDGMYLGSDVTAFVEYTRQVSYLEDGDVAHLYSDGITVFNEGERVEREIQTVDWDASAAGKAGHDHYMHKEIHEQPNALRQAISGRIDELAGNASLDIDLDDRFLQAIDEIHIVACGTSYHAGLYAKELLEELVDITVRVDLASEYEVCDGHDTRRTLVVAVTQSGETADTLSAIRRAKAPGMTTLAVTNTVGSTITREVDDSLFIKAGPEIGVAATKTFVSQVTALALFATYLGRLRGTLTAGEGVDILGNIRQLPNAVQSVLDSESRIRRLADQYTGSDAFFFIGRGPAYPVALESALKLKEISYAHAEGFAAGELKHGPLALVTENTPVLAFLNQSASPEETLNNVKEVESRGAPVICLSTPGETASFCNHTIEIPDIGRLEPLVANVALQLFAYHVAHEMGRPIDKPRNLAKSVTVE